MCTIPEVGARMHKAFTTGQIVGVVHAYTSVHRARGLWIKEGGES
jgi:hypothetical protein